MSYDRKAKYYDVLTEMHLRFETTDLFETTIFRDIETKRLMIYNYKDLPRVVEIPAGHGELFNNLWRVTTANNINKERLLKAVDNYNKGMALLETFS